MTKKIIKEYPYQNRGLKNLPGEKWKPVTGFDGKFEVSNLGRIKSLSHWKASGSGGFYTEEFIRKQNVRTAYNHYIKEKTYTVCISLKYNGVKWMTSTARLVYNAFVEPFDLSNKSIMISYKDSNGQNLNCKNLFMTDRKGLSVHIHKINRTKSLFPKMAVNQFTLDGKFVATYPSLTEATQKTGYHITGIMSCMMNHTHQHRGYRWEYADKNLIPKRPEKPKPVFNEYLWGMLGKPKTSKKSPIPVLNLSPETLPGEKWKPVEGFNGAYYISNAGRVKSTSRLTSGKVAKWEEGIVKKLLADNKKGEKTSCILTSVSLDGKKFEIAVGRLVYYHFVKKFDLKDKKLVIQYKDGCCYNLKPDNLMLVKKTLPQKSE